MTNPTNKEADSFGMMVRDFTSHGYMAKSEAHRRFKAIIQFERQAEREKITKKLGILVSRRMLSIIANDKTPIYDYGDVNADGKNPLRRRITLMMCPECEKKIEGGYMLKEGKPVHYRCYYGADMDQNWEAGWGPPEEEDEQGASS